MLKRGLIWRGGSSPRLRGTDLQAFFGSVRRRFIPAPAGNGTRLTPTLSATAVHPRACGERATASRPALHQRGSSPRLRGTATRHRGRIGYTRFIPAPAGNGARYCFRRCVATVHPRACGERLVGSPRVDERCGSSPRLRGTGELALLECFCTRFIPAPAGNGCRQGSE